MNGKSYTNILLLLLKYEACRNNGFWWPTEHGDIIAIGLWMCVCWKHNQKTNQNLRKQNLIINTSCCETVSQWMSLIKIQ